MSSKSQKRVKKLVSVSTTSTAVTGTRGEAVETTEVVESTEADKNREVSKGKYPENLAQVLCIRYPINFRKKPVMALLALGSKVNSFYPVFAKELGLFIRPTDIGVHKIDGIMFDTYEMVVIGFLLENKAN